MFKILFLLISCLDRFLRLLRLWHWAPEPSWCGHNSLVTSAWGWLGAIKIMTLDWWSIRHQSGIMIQLDCQVECNPMPVQTKIRRPPQHQPRSVVLRNSRRPVEHMHMIYIVYPCIYMVYTICIHGICRHHCIYHVYTMYIPCIYIVYIVYTWYIPLICIHHCIYHVYTMYIHGIYKEYSLNM